MSLPLDEVLDTVRRVESPEGVDLSLTPAGPVPRAFAWAVDTLIRLLLYAVFGIALGILLPEDFATGLFLIILFAVEWFYYVLFEVLRDGTTPGKSAMGLRAVHDDATPIGWSASLLRNLLRVADFLPALYGTGLVAMLLSRDFRRLGDQVAGTLVVYTDERPAKLAEVRARPHPPRLALTLDEQQSLLAFGERSASLTQERNAELAALAGPVTGQTGGRPEETLDQVLGVSAWIMGAR
ncbi:MAG: RDD family protein [Pseudomonadota bacterium]|nr:RDD family protein [Pseudomonadota bacterium]